MAKEHATRHTLHPSVDSLEPTKFELTCGHENYSYEIMYNIGSTYLVCAECSDKIFFARGIKSKKEISHK